MSWQASSFLLLAAALAVGFGWYERARPTSRVIALVAAMAALAVVGRLAFAAIPNVKPTTDIVLFAGYALGAVPGFAVGAVTAIVSNIFLSQGPWTVWQMAGWGAVGVGGALLARMMRGREPSRLVLALVCGLAGLAFGVWMDVYQWTLGARQDLDSYLLVATTSLPYNLAHAIGNVVFCLLIGPAFIRALARYRRRLEVRWVPAAAGATGLLLALLAALPVAAGAATPAERAERYVLRAQNDDGGFGAAPGQASSPLYSGWAGLGLAAAGRNPLDVAPRGGRSLGAYERRGLRGLRDIGEIERTVMLLEAAGLDSHDAGGRDLVARIEARRRPDGSIAGFVSYTAFGVLALRAAGEPAGRATVRWLAGSQNEDGGFGLTRSSPSDADMTGAALQALAVVGRARGPAAGRAVEYLRRSQAPDGGFGLAGSGGSNAQSTAYAVQGLVACASASGPVSRGLAYLIRLQRRDGSIAYSSGSAQTPVWVTAQALAALRRTPLPIAAVPRAPRPAVAAAERAPAAEAEAQGARGAVRKAADEGAKPPAVKSAGSRRSDPAVPDDAGVEPTPAAPERANSDSAAAGPAPAPAAARAATAGDGAGVSGWLVIGAVIAALAVLLLMRRRLPARRA